MSFSIIPKMQISDFLDTKNNRVNYYPFGWSMPGRRFEQAEYRYGFNGQEMDNEIKGTGNSLNYTFRMYDPRVSRFFAVDPIAAEYPELTPYQFASNSPIINIELEGLEGGNSNSVFGARTIGFGMTFSLSGDKNIFNKIQFTTGVRQDFGPFESQEIPRMSGSFGITPRIEAKATVTGYPSFAFAGYVKGNTNINMPNGYFSGELSVGPFDYNAKATHSGKEPFDKYLKKEKSRNPAAPNQEASSPIKAPSLFGVAKSLGTSISSPSGSIPIAMKYGYKPPLTMSDDILSPNISTSDIGSLAQDYFGSPQIEADFTPIDFNRFNTSTPEGGSGQTN